MKKRDLIIYKVITGLFSIMMLMGAGMYFLQYEMVAGMFTKLGFPTFIIYPLAVAKILGLIAIWTRKSQVLFHMAYAGYIFDLMLATAAHINVADGEFAGALVVLVLVILSYFMAQRNFGSSIRKIGHN